ncbi:peptide ABC transporter permease [Catellatospora sp. TT07R-123]|uniref:ABC transporter permease n=1 Tax=Catellatospora sp. TT07R-123 TaxID=2733863 RepID=UPI001B11E03F|nr:ABC transporter permease [Catellatospora sp. TT07R-123]GHJ46034.1 peptide ABC transporter permease [Catellatospora sp. TT07R-123]
MSEFENVAASELHTATPGPAGEPNAPGQPHTLEVKRARSATTDAWHDLARRPLFWIAVLIALVALVMAVFPQLFTSGDPNVACQLSKQNAGPSGPAIFGFDYQGCDVYTRAIYGARNSLLIGFFAALFAGVLAILAGLTSGFFGGWVDAVISRGTDIVLGLPLILAGLVIMKRVDNAGGGNTARIIAFVLLLGGLGWTTASRVVRSSVISAKNQDYVQAARMLGAGNARIMWRHILPNALAPFLVVITIALGSFIAAEASLSFLGVGLEPPAQSWGLQISQASGIGKVRTNPIPLIVPSTFLALTVLAFIILGDKIREAFDPKLR